MKKVHVVSKPIKVSDMNLEEDYIDVYHSSEGKARSVQIKKWREMKRDMRGGYRENH
jgi:hypothetical protein